MIKSSLFLIVNFLKRAPNLDGHLSSRKGKVVYMGLGRGGGDFKRGGKLFGKGLGRGEGE
jgi:hypothetical protein